MSELEALNNKELRAKCMEFGMANIPVTDSSRKVIIRRLEAAMSGKPLTPAKSNRRETMHVSKPSEIASSPKVNLNNNNNNSMKPPASTNRPSRRTIAATERHVTTTTTVSEPEYSDVSPDRVPPEPVRVSKAKTPERATLYPKLPAKEPSPKPQVLSKTGVVTTSFVQETKKNVHKTYAAPDDIDSTEDEEIAQDLTRPSASLASSRSYAPLSESKVSTSNPLPSTLSSSTRYSSTSAYFNKPSDLSKTASTIVGAHKSYASPSSLSYSQYNRTVVPEKYDLKYNDDLEMDTENADEYESESEDEVVVVEDSPLGKDVQTPFLSQFARNLENLKATPLRHSVGPTKITPPKSAAALRQRDMAYSRRTIGAAGSSLGGGGIAPRRSLKIQQEDDSPFRQFIMALEEKYHLKQTFIIISIFILALFIYVFFIQTD